MTTTPISLDLVLSALGRGTEDTALIARFDAATLRNWPDPEDDREMVEGYWRFGFALEFDHRVAFERRYGRAGAQGPLVVSAIVFYADEDEGYTTWAHALPAELSFDMSPADVAKQLGSAVATRAPYDRRVDKFFVGDHVLDVCFDDDEQRIAFVSIRLKDIYEREVAPTSDLRWEALAQAIAQDVESPTLHASLASALRVPVTSDELDDRQNDAFHEDLGLTFYSLKGKEMPGAGDKSVARKRLVSGIKFCRAGVARSSGYAGTLPFGLNFGDGPDAVRAKLPPDAFQDAYEAGGRFTCTVDGYFFHVYVSLVFWQTIAVSVFHESQAAD
ncbi:hypothetical protein FXN63_15540 [Pigmentiphaga aceris]|uniref:Uncharacterized protein n=1 Tax=Pigmentiphaga aceris TaxID=1940612 RepID=A0A5C0B069_9BURK|nr:hypothetical protein [Pigmentiphaga aceris]QEI07093.1 hypothetical protein FXN63_15540 [Pigmentiphaga aceris]